MNKFAKRGRLYVPHDTPAPASNITVEKWEPAPELSTAIIRRIGSHRWEVQTVCKHGECTGMYDPMQADRAGARATAVAAHHKFYNCECRP